MQEDNETEILINPALFKPQPALKGHQNDFPQVEVLRQPSTQTQLQQESSIQQSILTPPSPSLSTPSHQNIQTIDNDQVNNILEIVFQIQLLNYYLMKLKLLLSLNHHMHLQVRWQDLQEKSNPQENYLSQLLGKHLQESPILKSIKPMLYIFHTILFKLCKKLYEGQILNNGNQPFRLHLIL